MGRLSPEDGEFVSVPCEKTGWNTHVRAPFLQGMVDMEGGGREDQVFVRSQVSTAIDYRKAKNMSLFYMVEMKCL